MSGNNGPGNAPQRHMEHKEIKTELAEIKLYPCPLAANATVASAVAGDP
jgi:hypothetical protein